MTDTPFISVTQNALQKALELRLKEAQENNSIAEKYKLRLFVEGGGCAGFQYGMVFDTKVNDGDRIEKIGDLEIIVDPMSQMYLKGTKMNFFESAIGSGFKFENPNATGGCGCGHSFSA